jgi:hypothetical protein
VVAVVVAVDMGIPQGVAHRSSPVVTELGRGLEAACRIHRHHQGVRSYRTRKGHSLGLALAGNIVELGKTVVRLVPVL